MTPKPPQCKFQVFISSTFVDLREEREYVSWEILKLRHIPAGMENFTAKNDRGWNTIRRVIDVSDYYIIIIAGRYGSVYPDWNQSWTHHEYEYASAKGIPVLVFIRDLNATPGDQVDADRTRLNDFISEIKGKYLCTVWRTKDDLAKAVSAALTTQIADDLEDEKPRPGWYRGDALPPIPHEFGLELARLSKEEARLRKELTEAQTALEQQRDAGTRATKQVIDRLSKHSYVINDKSVNLSRILSIIALELATGATEYSITPGMISLFGLLDDDPGKGLYEKTGYKMKDIMGPLVLLGLVNVKTYFDQDYYYLTTQGALVASTLRTD